MAQRIYWVPHTVCFLGCEHCHNDSVLPGIRASRRVIDGIVAHLPDPASRYRLEDVVVGGGEALMRNAEMEYLVRAFRERFPRGPQATVAERRAAGSVILSLQTMGLPLADARGNPLPKNIDYWVDLGVDCFHIASNDPFHERRRPDYPWQTLRDNLAAYQSRFGVEFLIYGKSVARLVPSGRVLDNLETLESDGASLLTEEGYCANAWEAAGNFLTGQAKQHPDCSEVVLDPQGWVHPCCWYELSPGLFDLTATRFEDGMETLCGMPLCQALDRGDMIRFAQLSGFDAGLARSVRAKVGECGLCRLCSVSLSHQPELGWMGVPPLSEREASFYSRHLGSGIVAALPQAAGQLDKIQPA